MMSSPFVFGSTETMQQPKSPKSPKAIENPLLKSSHLMFPAAPTLVNERDRGHEKSPFPSILSANTTNSRPTVAATPGPPPKASISLGFPNLTVQDYRTAESQVCMLCGIFAYDRYCQSHFSNIAASIVPTTFRNRMYPMFIAQEPPHLWHPRRF